MGDQLAVPLHFAAEFLILAVSAGAALAALRRALRDERRAFAPFLGFAFVAVAQVLHGVLVVPSDDAPLLLALQLSGVFLVAVSMRRAERPLVAALSAFAAGEAVLLLAPESQGGWLAGTHAIRAAGALALALWLRASIARSVRLRFVAGFVASLLVVVLVVSLALNQVIADNLEREELERLALAGRAEVAQLVERSASAQEFASAVAENPRIGQYFSSRPDLLPPSAKLLLAGFTRAVDFLIFVDARGRVVGSAGGSPARALSRSEELSLAGTDVIGEVLKQGRPVSSPDSVAGTQIVVVGAAPVRARGDVIGAVALGLRVDSAAVRGLADDTGSAVSLLVQGAVVTSTLGRPESLAPGFTAISDQVDRVRSDGVAARARVSFGGEGYLTALVPILRSDGVPVGILAFSRSARVLASAQEPINRTLFLIALAAGALASALAWIFGGRVARPIRSLTEAAEELSGGNLEARATVGSQDEVGLLGRSFNEMAASLSAMTAELREAADEEAALRNRIEAIMQSMGDGLVATDAAGRVVLWNRAAEGMVGRSAERAVGRPLGEVLSGIAEGRPVAEFVLAGKSAEGVLERPDGSTMLVALISEPLLDADGGAIGRVVVFRDVTREREAERMKTEFLANVSHELRTPITPIKGYADIMRRKDVPREKMNEFLDAILESSARLERIVEILVDVAAMDAGRLRARLEPVDARMLVDLALDRWRERSGHRFVRKIPAGLPPVAADPKLISRCLDELIDNAVKFSPAGGRVELRAEAVPGAARSRRPAAVRIEVHDQGIGIPPEQMPSLFEDFRQIDGSETRTFGGLGLGLAYVRRIAAVHHGRIQAESTPGRGSTFSLVLPLADTSMGVAGGALRSVAAGGRGGRSGTNRGVLKVVRRTDGRRHAKPKATGRKAR